ncbi:MAG: hypothetical protein KKD11_01800, partial [Candidatus Omnitrophica bacterium]|nr:hypothetical protein [Candidatus Omnitrophota bacterium]
RKLIAVTDGTQTISSDDEEFKKKGALFPKALKTAVFAGISDVASKASKLASTSFGFYAAKAFNSRYSMSGSYRDIFRESNKEGIKKSSRLYSHYYKYAAETFSQLSMQARQEIAKRNPNWSGPANFLIGVVEGGIGGFFLPISVFADPIGTGTGFVDMVTQMPYQLRHDFSHFLGSLVGFAIGMRLWMPVGLFRGKGEGVGVVEKLTSRSFKEVNAVKFSSVEAAMLPRFASRVTPYMQWAGNRALGLGMRLGMHTVGFVEMLGVSWAAGQLGALIGGEQGRGLGGLFGFFGMAPMFNGWGRMREYLRSPERLLARLKDNAILRDNDGIIWQSRGNRFYRLEEGTGRAKNYIIIKRGGDFTKTGLDLASHSENITMNVESILAAKDGDVILHSRDGTLFQKNGNEFCALDESGRPAVSKNYIIIKRGGDFTKTGLDLASHSENITAKIDAARGQMAEMVEGRYRRDALGEIWSVNGDRLVRLTQKGKPSTRPLDSIDIYDSTGKFNFRAVLKVARSIDITGAIKTGETFFEALGKWARDAGNTFWKVKAGRLTEMNNEGKPAGRSIVIKNPDSSFNIHGIMEMMELGIKKAGAEDVYFTRVIKNGNRLELRVIDAEGNASTKKSTKIFLDLTGQQENPRGPAMEVSSGVGRGKEVEVYKVTIDPENPIEGRKLRAILEGVASDLNANGLENARRIIGEYAKGSKNLNTLDNIIIKINEKGNAQPENILFTKSYKLETKNSRLNELRGKVNGRGDLSPQDKAFLTLAIELHRSSLRETNYRYQPAQTALSMANFNALLKGKGVKEAFGLSCAGGKTIAQAAAMAAYSYLYPEAIIVFTTTAKNIDAMMENFSIANLKKRGMARHTENGNTQLETGVNIVNYKTLQELGMNKRKPLTGVSLICDEPQAGLAEADLVISSGANYRESPEYIRGIVDENLGLYRKAYVTVDAFLRKAQGLKLTDKATRDGRSTEYELSYNNILETLKAEPGWKDITERLGDTECNEIIDAAATAWRIRAGDRYYLTTRDGRFIVPTERPGIYYVYNEKMDMLGERRYKTEDIVGYCIAGDNGEPLAGTTFGAGFLDGRPSKLGVMVGIKHGLEHAAIGDIYLQRTIESTNVIKALKQAAEGGVVILNTGTLEGCEPGLRELGFEIRYFDRERSRNDVEKKEGQDYGLTIDVAEDQLSQHGKIKTIVGAELKRAENTGQPVIITISGRPLEAREIYETLKKIYDGKIEVILEFSDRGYRRLEKSINKAAKKGALESQIIVGNFAEGVGFLKEPAPGKEGPTFRAAIIKTDLCARDKLLQTIQRASVARDMTEEVGGKLKGKQRVLADAYWVVDETSPELSIAYRQKLERARTPEEKIRTVKEISDEMLSQVKARNVARALEDAAGRTRLDRSVHNAYMSDYIAMNKVSDVLLATKLSQHKMLDKKEEFEERLKKFGFIDGEGFLRYKGYAFVEQVAGYSKLDWTDRMRINKFFGLRLGRGMKRECTLEEAFKAVEGVYFDEDIEGLKLSDSMKLRFSDIPFILGLAASIGLKLTLEDIQKLQEQDEPLAVYDYFSEKAKDNAAVDRRRSKALVNGVKAKKK